MRLAMDKGIMGSHVNSLEGHSPRSIVPRLQNRRSAGGHPAHLSSYDGLPLRHRTILMEDASHRPGASERVFRETRLAQLKTQTWLV